MRQLPTDANFSLRGDVLARAIQKDKAKGLIPFFVSTYTFSHLLSAKARQLFGGEFGNSSFTKTHRQSAYQSVVSAKEIEQNFGTEQNRSTLVHALIEKMTPILGVLKLVKKSHLFRGHVDPLFRCPKSNFSQKLASYENLTSFAWESDTHKWSIFKVIRGVRESLDTRHLIDGCKTPFESYWKKGAVTPRKGFRHPSNRPEKGAVTPRKGFRHPSNRPEKGTVTPKKVS